MFLVLNEKGLGEPFVRILCMALVPKFLLTGKIVSCMAAPLSPALVCFCGFVHVDTSKH